MTYNEAREEAARVSREEECTVNINAVCGLVNGKPEIVTFRISDWYSSEATVATFTMGEGD